MIKLSLTIKCCCCFILGIWVSRVWNNAGVLVVGEDKSIQQTYHQSKMLFRDDIPGLSIIKHEEDGDTVAMCAIQKGAEAYIDEWVNYYFGLGVARVYIYDNSDSFDLERWAKRRARSVNGTSTGGGAPLEVFHIPGKGVQKQAYDMCINQIRSYNSQIEKSKQLKSTTINWAAMYDIDEFLVLRKHQTIGGLVKEHCPLEKGCAGLVVNWLVFSSGEETAFAPLTKRFQYRSRALSDHVKSIVHVNSYISWTWNPHCFKYLNNGTAFDTQGPAPCPYHDDGVDSVAALYHFYTKSRAEFAYRCIRGRASKDVPYCPVFPNSTKSKLVFDDTAWQVLKHNIPGYQFYDQDGASMYGWNS
jgi:Glycosyl transferase family 2